MRKPNTIVQRVMPGHARVLVDGRQAGAVYKRYVPGEGWRWEANTNAHDAQHKGATALDCVRWLVRHELARAAAKAVA